MALSLTAETESIDSEKWLFDYKLQEYKDSNPNHSTNLRLTVQIHSTFSRVVQKPINLIHHSDRGVQYVSAAYTSLLYEAGIHISMTESGDPKDNAVAERLNSTIKNELFKDIKFHSIEEVK